MRPRDLAIWSPISFVLILLFMRFVLNEDWGQAIAIAIVVGFITPGAAAARRRRREMPSPGNPQE